MKTQTKNKDLKIVGFLLVAIGLAYFFTYKLPHYITSDKNNKSITSGLIVNKNKGVNLHGTYNYYVVLRNGTDMGDIQIPPYLYEECTINQDSLSVFNQGSVPVYWLKKKKKK